MARRAGDVPPREPAAAPGEPAPSAQESLQSLWDSFSEAHDPARATLQDFDVWLEEALEAPGSAERAALPAEIEVEGRGSVRTVTVSGASAPDGPSLMVEERSWAAADHVLAVGHLGCVLCHGEVQGDDGPARVFSAEPHAPRSDEDVALDGAISSDPGTVFLGDPRLDLTQLRLGRGRLRASVGWRAAPRAPRPAPGALEPQELRDEVLGPVLMVGTDEDPIRLEGSVTIEGDLCLVGVVQGAGALYVTGNLFLPVGIRRSDDEGPVPLLVVEGSVLAGDVLRPRQGMSVPVTGDPEGSFGFLPEVLARFNGRAGARFVLLEGQAAHSLPAGGTTGDWFDPRLAEHEGPGAAVGPSLTAEGQPWFELGFLRRTFDGEPLSQLDRGLRLDGTFVVEGAFVAVATGLEAEPGDAGRDEQEGDGPPPGSVLMHGSLAARHAAVHAPAGVSLLDRASDRARLTHLFAGGLHARLEQGQQTPRIPPGGVRGLPTRARLAAPESPRTGTYR